MIFKNEACDSISQLEKSTEEFSKTTDKHLAILDGRLDNFIDETKLAAKATSEAIKSLGKSAEEFSKTTDEHLGILDGRLDNFIADFEQQKFTTNKKIKIAYVIAGSALAITITQFILLFCGIL